MLYYREQLERRAVELGLPTHRVRDAGRTQVEAGTSTVLAVAGIAYRYNSRRCLGLIMVLIGPEHLVDQVTGKLDLY